MNLYFSSSYTAQTCILSHALVRMAILVLVAIAATGCDRTDKLIESQVAEKSQASSRIPGGRFTSVSSPAMKLLQECLEAYRSLESYEDRATVNLTYVYNGESITDQAPLSVAWDDTGRLGFKVYSVQAGVEHERWRLRIADGDKALNGQIISRAVPAELSMQWLLADEFAASYLSAGLAGFPPQLDLLLASEPLQGMLTDQSKLSLLEDRVIHGKNCRGIAIDRDGRNYRLWLSDETKLIHRIDYPREHLPPDILRDERVSSISLHVDLHGIHINQPINWQRYEVPVDPSDRLVQRFLPPPPPVDTSRLGKQVPSFQLLGPDGQVVFRSGGSGVAHFTVLVWLADHPTSEVAVEQLRQVERRVREMGIDQSQVDFVNVWAEPKPPQGLSLEQIPERWELPGQFALDFHAAGRDLFGITEAPSMVVLDRSGKVQVYEERLNPVLQDVLPQLLRNLCDGIDVASEVAASFDTIQNRFASELDMVRASDDRRTQTQLAAYPPLAVDLVEVKRSAVSTPTVASTIDNNQNVWLLDAHGRLTSTALNDQVNASIAIEKFSFGSNAAGDSLPAAPPAVRLSISSDGRFAAVWEGSQHRVTTVDCHRKSQNRFRIPENADVLDMRWVTLPELDHPTLVVLIDNSSVVMLDPITREHLSGQNEVQPVAVCEATDAVGIKPWIVTSDGQVEPLIVGSSDKLGARVSPTNSTPLSIGSSPAPAVTSTLSFQPDVGPWSMVGDGKSTLTCARGFVAEQESGLFLLNDKLEAVGQVRVPASQTGMAPVLSAAIDPNSGRNVWVYCADGRTVQILRQFDSDDQVPRIALDHCRFDQPLVNAALVAHGEKLLLVVHSKSETAVFEVRWRDPAAATTTPTPSTQQAVTAT